MYDQYLIFLGKLNNHYTILCFIQKILMREIDAAKHQEVLDKLSTQL